MKKNISFIYSERKQFYIISLLLYGLAIANGYLFSFLNDYYNSHSGNNEIHKLSKDNLFIAAIIVSPILETALFQYLPIELVLKFHKKFWSAIIISGLLFCLMHFYSPLYMLATFIGGLILAIYYCFVRSYGKIAFLYTIVFHALYNLYGFLFIS